MNENILFSLDVPQVSDVCSLSDVVLFIPHSEHVSFPAVVLYVLTGHGSHDRPAANLPVGHTTMIINIASFLV